MANRIAEIIIPKLDNDGKSLTWVHQKAMEYMARNFGGYTAIDSRGGWLDDGKLYHDESVTYRVAMTLDGTHTSIWRQFAVNVAIWGEQLCIAVTFANGDFVLIGKDGENYGDE